jgi:acetyltransferase-like isoleucine patch superfamily enzyme
VIRRGVQAASMKRIIGSLLNRFAFACPGGSSIRPLLQRWRGVVIGKNVWIGLYVYLDDLHPAALTIGDNCTIGMRTSIFTHLYWGPRRAAGSGSVIIEDNVFIGPHCVILPNVRIGEGAVIKAGTIVTRNVPPHTFWGAPAPESLAQVTVPLTSAASYAEFLRGLRPVKAGTRTEPMQLATEHPNNPRR